LEGVDISIATFLQSWEALPMMKLDCKNGLVQLKKNVMNRKTCE